MGEEVLLGKMGMRDEELEVLEQERKKPRRRKKEVRDQGAKRRTRRGNG